ncbi:MAG: threonine/serine dehydratase [Synergistaceae bacterium]|nr:threonine/serine dehydratase [Synergistaceae bacterium]
MPYEVSITDILLAARFLKNRTRRTPLEFSPALSMITGGKVWLKLENQQVAGSFKPRGAFNRMFAMTEEERQKGVITCSSGNHAQGIAMAARELRTKAVICVPGQCPQVKREAILEKGGDFVELRVIGTYYDEAEIESMKMAEEEKLIFISAFDDPYVSAGQGTVGLEMLEDEPELDVILCQISGAGLIRGVATAAKALRPGIAVWGVHAKANPAWPEAVKKGEVRMVNEEVSLADALGGGACQNHLDFVLNELEGLLAVSEEDIAKGIRFMFEKHHQLVEGAGAIGVAAVLAGEIDLKDKRAGIVVSGGNIGEEKLLAALQIGRQVI